MARYTVRHSYVDVIGSIWMPCTMAAMRYTLSQYDIDNMREIVVQGFSRSRGPRDFGHVAYTGADVVSLVAAHHIDDGISVGAKITRESVEQWLMSHSGDFQSVTDFRASIEDGEETIEIDWAEEDSACTYSDCMFPDED